MKKIYPILLHAKTKDGISITYQELMDENYELLSENSILRYEINIKDRYLDLIKRQYGVTIIERNNKVLTEETKIDSALILLNEYRDKIKYDPQKECGL